MFILNVENYKFSDIFFVDKEVPQNSMMDYLLLKINYLQIILSPFERCPPIIIALFS